MVDFWEVFGRMLTNDDFRGDLYRNSPDTFYCVGVEVPTTDFPDFGNKGLEIDSKYYDIARKIVAGVITDGPVSLATLGELLMVLSSCPFRKLADTLAAQIQSSVNTANGSKLFYIAIGCMMLDGFIFHQFSNANFDDLQFGGLTGLERDALTRLGNTTTPNVRKAANAACLEFWDIACNDDYAYYPVQDSKQNAFVLQQKHHLHILVQPYPPPEGLAGDQPRRVRRSKDK